jgi:hypothetical protein
MVQRDVGVIAIEKIQSSWPMGCCSVWIDSTMTLIQLEAGVNRPSGPANFRYLNNSMEGAQVGS